MLVENGIVNINERDDKGSTPAHKGMWTTLFTQLKMSDKNIWITIFVYCRSKIVWKYSILNNFAS